MCAARQKGPSPAGRLSSRPALRQPHARVLSAPQRSPHTGATTSFIICPPAPHLHCSLLYLGRKMALWRKFSKILKKTRSSFSRSFSSGVFWQAQHRPFSAPAMSDLVGLVFSSMSMSPVAGMRIGIFSSVSGKPTPFRNLNYQSNCVIQFNTPPAKGLFKYNGKMFSSCIFQVQSHNPKNGSPLEQ